MANLKQSLGFVPLNSSGTALRYCCGDITRSTVALLLCSSDIVIWKKQATYEHRYKPN